MAWSLVGTNVSGTGGVASVALTAPAATQAGDIMLAAFYWDDTDAGTNAATPPPITMPAGWTQIGYAEQQNVPSRDFYLIAAYKIAATGDAGSTFTFTANPVGFSGWKEAGLGVWRDSNGPVPSTGTVEDSDFAASASAGTAIVCPSSTSLTAGALHIIAASSWSASSYSPPAGYSEAFDNASELAVAWDELGAAGATGTKTYTASSSDFWGGASIVIKPATGGGGTVLTVTLTGSIAPTAALPKRGNLLRLGGLTPAGAVAKALSRLWAGSLTPAGALTKFSPRTFAGSLTATGTAAFLRAIALTLAGSIAPASALIKRLSLSAAGSLAPAGVLSKRLARLASGAITPAGALVKRASKALAGGITPTGALSSLIQAGGHFITLLGSIAPTGSLGKRTNLLRAGAIEPLSGLGKRLARAFAGGVTPASALTAGRTLLVTLTGSLTPAAALALDIAAFVLRPWVRGRMSAITTLARTGASAVRARMSSRR